MSTEPNGTSTTTATNTVSTTIATANSNDEAKPTLGALNNCDSRSGGREEEKEGTAESRNGPETAEARASNLLNSLIDDVIFCECLQVHRAAKMGLIFTEPNEETYRIKDGVGLDVFGQPLTKKKQFNCTCPQCGRNIAASRLAPHLEKCMGMGRLSARAASNKRETT